MKEILKTLNAWESPLKRLRDVEKALQDINDGKYKIRLLDGEIKTVQPAEAVLVYAPYIWAVQIGPCAENMTQLLLLAAHLCGHPNYKAIKFTDAAGKDISREMIQAYIDRFGRHFNEHGIY